MFSMLGEVVSTIFILFGLISSVLALIVVREVYGKNLKEAFRNYVETKSLNHLARQNRDRTSMDE